MGTTTMGVKLDDATRERIKSAATRIDRTPHWLIKQAIFLILNNWKTAILSRSYLRCFLARPMRAMKHRLRQRNHTSLSSTLPNKYCPSRFPAPRSPRPIAARKPKRFLCCWNKLACRSQLLNRRTNWRINWPINCVIKNASGRAGMVQGLLQEFSLSSQEGVALMCLAEALLRIPDKATRDALIRDKISNGNWQSHIGRSPSLFVNAATRGLLFTGKLVSTHNEASLSRSLNRIIGKSGEPLIRKGVDMAMRLMGEQFVTGETIAEALANARKLEEKGFRYSYDMLGEAALTAADAQARRFPISRRFTPLVKRLTVVASMKVRAFQSSCRRYIRVIAAPSMTG